MIFCKGVFAVKKAAVVPMLKGWWWHKDLRLACARMRVGLLIHIQLLAVHFYCGSTTLPLGYCKHQQRLLIQNKHNR